MRALCPEPAENVAEKTVVNKRGNERAGQSAGVIPPVIRVCYCRTYCISDGAVADHYCTIPSGNMVNV